MKVKDETAWNAWRTNNTDPYGSAVIRYAERWADAMETAMASGETLAGCAKRTSHEADTEGITGFMYGAAVQTLATSWEHGEELRRWHNLDTQISDEGEKANDKPGAVLNPAIMRIGGAS